MLDVNGLTKSFGGVHALRDVSFRAEPGCVTGLIGPNGAGKSTLLSCLSGWLRPDQGVIHFDGRELGGEQPRRLAQAGVIRSFQNLQLFDGLSVKDNLMLGAWRLGRSGLPGALVRTRRARSEQKTAAASALEVAERLDIEAELSTPVADLPYGTRKKVELARALIAQPRLLLLDEPAAGLDDHERAALAQALTAATGSMTVVLVEHAVEMVLALSSSVVVLDFGAVIAQGDPETIRNDPRVIEAYLGVQT